MKTILSLIAILIVNLATAQSDTTISIHLKQIEANVNHINTNLIKCHEQWRDGLGITVFGIGVSTLGVVIINQNYNNYTSGSHNIKPSNYKNNENVGLIITGVGGLTSLIGTIIMLDSHKYIGKAGLGINGNAITYRFK